MDVLEEYRPEDVRDDPDTPEDPGLYHGDGVEEGAHGCGSYHGGGQPRVKRHHTCLDSASDEVGDEQNLEHPDGDVMALQESSGRELEGSRVDVSGPDGEQQQDPGGQGIGQILPSRLDGFVILVVDDERVGRDGQHFVEDIEGKEIAGEGDPHRGGQAEGEGEEIPVLGVFLEPPHIADGIEGRDDPEPGRHEPEDDAEEIDLEHERQPRGNFKKGQFDDFSMEDEREHAQDNAEFDKRRDKRPGLPQVLAPFVCEEDKEGPDEGNEDCIQGFVGDYDIHASPLGTMNWRRWWIICMLKIPTARIPTAMMRMGMSIMSGASATATAGVSWCPCPPVTRPTKEEK